MSGCPFHKMLHHLKVFAGLPVPETVKWVNGKPDFRQIDEDKLAKAVKYKLCAVCGKRLKFYAFWIGGERTLQFHYFTDAPMHKECAEESMRLCPFLNGTRQHYRGELPTHELHDTSARPERMYLMRGVTAAFEVRMLGKAPVLYAGDLLTAVQQF
jgi:hypothetical protein